MFLEVIYAHKSSVTDFTCIAFLEGVCSVMHAQTAFRDERQRAPITLEGSAVLVNGPHVVFPLLPGLERHSAQLAGERSNVRVRHSV